MSKNNVYLRRGRGRLLAWLMLLISSTVITTTAALADATFTVKEATELQAKIARAELEAKQREVESKGGGGRGKEIILAPAPVRSDDLVFVGHYGIENDVKADFLLNNVLVTFSLKGKTEIGGWHIDKLTPRMARMCRMSAKRKNVGCKDIFLASESNAMAMQKTGNVAYEAKTGTNFSSSSTLMTLPTLPTLPTFPALK